MPDDQSLICVVGTKTEAIRELNGEIDRMEQEALERDDFAKMLGTIGIQEVVDDLEEFRSEAQEVYPGYLMDVCPNPSAAGYVGYLLLGFIADDGRWYRVRMSAARAHAEQFTAYCDAVKEQNGLSVGGRSLREF